MVGHFVAPMLGPECRDVLVGRFVALAATTPGSGPLPTHKESSPSVRGLTRRWWLFRCRGQATEAVLVSLDPSDRAACGRRQLPARHFRPHALGRRLAAQNDRGRGPAGGLGNRCLAAAVPGARGRMGVLPTPAGALRRPAGVPLVTATAAAVDDDLWSAIGDATRRRMRTCCLPMAMAPPPPLAGSCRSPARRLPAIWPCSTGPGSSDRRPLAGATLPGGRRPDGPGRGPAGVGRLCLGCPLATHQTDRRGDPP